MNKSAKTVEYMSGKEVEFKSTKKSRTRRLENDFKSTKKRPDKIDLKVNLNLTDN